MTDNCNELFKVRLMKKAVRCELPAGHKSKYHQHRYRNYTVRVWPETLTSKRRFRFFARKGKSLPNYMG